MLRLGLLIGPLVLALAIFCVVDVISRQDDEVRGLPRYGWLLLILFFPLIGSIAWLVAGRPRSGPARRTTYGPASAGFPEYDRPGRAAAADPEADAEFLRKVRERAEEQRRRAREQAEQKALGENNQQPDEPTE